MPTRDDPTGAIGVPDAAPRFFGAAKGEDSPVPPATAPAKSPAPSPVHRENECIANVPDATPDLLAADVASRPLASVNTDPVGDAEGGVPRAFGWLGRGYLAAVALLAGLFGLFVFGQVINTLALMDRLPAWAWWLCAVPVGLCGLVVLGVCVSMIMSWFRLRKFRQVNMDALAALAERAKTRQDGIRHGQEACERLKGYLEAFPLGGAEDGEGAPCPPSGLDPETLADLREKRAWLSGRKIDSMAWIAAFRAHFQAPLDGASDRLVKRYALQAGLCAMASPLPLLDTLLILGLSMRMIRDLCGIYRLRVTSMTAPVLFVRVVRNAFLAGVGQETARWGYETAEDWVKTFSGAGASDGAADGAAETAAEVAGHTMAGGIASSAMRFVGPKLAEGAVNALFMQRLGRAAIRLLQPVGTR